MEGVGEPSQELMELEVVEGLQLVTLSEASREAYKDNGIEPAGC